MKEGKGKVFLKRTLEGIEEEDQRARQGNKKKKRSTPNLIAIIGSGSFGGESMLRSKRGGGGWGVHRMLQRWGESLREKSKVAS